MKFLYKHIVAKRRGIVHLNDILVKTYLVERFIQHEVLFIRHFTTTVWPYPLHSHNHFELIFIHSGSGYHELNGRRDVYRSKTLFLLAPADYHIFDILEETEFSVLKFHNNYFDDLAQSSVKNEWNQLINHLLAISSANNNYLIKSVEELNKIDSLMRLIVTEWQESLNATNEVIFYLMRSVFALIKKNAMQNQVTVNSVNRDLFIAIMDYVHLNIYHPERLQLTILANQFNFSANHLNSLFKKQIGISIKKYIDDYKFKLIENRLKFSGLMFKELSIEFGFSDLSHFNKFLKKYGGQGPKHIRSNP